jgi:hypothetical protein
LRQPVETAHYLSIKCCARLAEVEIGFSVATGGDAYDNAGADCVVVSGACAAPQKNRVNDLLSCQFQSQAE